MQLIKAIKTTTEIEGQTKDVLISIEVDHDQFDPIDLSSDYIAGIHAQLERGQTKCVWLKVTARFTELDHFEGLDTMGQVLSKTEADVLRVVQDYGMINNALVDLLAQVLQGKSQINTFLGRVS